MRVPNHKYVVDQQRRVYELDVRGTCWCYRVSTKAELFANTTAPFRSLRASEAMVRVGHDCFVVSHACVVACHCPQCGADVGNLCFGSGRQRRRLTTQTHYQRRDLYRAVLAKRGGG